MKKILVVEDDEMISNVYRTKLQFVGFEVSVAYDGQKGLSIALDSHPDLILLDIALPKMDGMAVLQELRKDPWGTNVPVILLTNFDADDEKLNRILKDKPAYYLVKSTTDLDVLVEKVKSALGLTDSSSDVV
jgi:DNA-binding response OmpR family regulator